MAKFLRAHAQSADQIRKNVNVFLCTISNSAPTDSIYIKFVKHEKTHLHTIVIIKERNREDVNWIGPAQDMVQ
jgi:hypothetical protein